MNFFKREVSIDETQLNSASQQKVASLVKAALREDELSLSWRSDLNAKLAAAQQLKAKKRTTRRYYAWGSSLSLGVAATAFAVLIINPQVPNTHPRGGESEKFASELVKAHQESMVLASVSGTGAATRETSFVDDSAYGLQDELL